MTWLQRQIANTPKPETILHIGAGRCSELDTWQETGAKRIVLVEPNPELLPELRRRTQGIREIEIIPAAIAADAGRETLYLFNFPLLASLREPTGLHSILPGLQQTDRAMVETKPLATLVDELQFDPDGRHWLIIEAPGMESEIVDQLIADDRAAIFTTVDVIAGREPWYQGSEPVQALVERLEQAGYEYDAVDTANDPDWPRATFRYSRHAAENKRLAEEVERLQESLRSQKEEFSRHFAELSQERDELKSGQAQLEHEHAELKQARDELQTKLEAEQQNVRASAEENESLQKQNSQLTNELENLKQAADEAHKQIESLRGERDEFEALFEESVEDVKALERKLSEAKQDAQNARNDLGIALRLQNLRENDLTQLQQRYGALQDTNEQQRELLAKLHQRLSAAANYLRLNADDDENHSPQVEQIVRALTGSGPEDQ